MENSAVRAIVVEDDEVMRMILAEIFEEAGYAVFQASCGSDAMKLLAQPLTPDIIVTDINIPAPDGLTVSWSARERYPHVAVLFITGRAEPFVLGEAPIPHKLLNKPVQLATITETAKKMIESARCLS